MHKCIPINFVSLTIIYSCWNWCHYMRHYRWVCYRTFVLYAPRLGLCNEYLLVISIFSHADNVTSRADLISRSAYALFDEFMSNVSHLRQPWDVPVRRIYQRALAGGRNIYSVVDSSPRHAVGVWLLIHTGCCCNYKQHWGLVRLVLSDFKLMAFHFATSFSISTATNRTKNVKTICNGDIRDLITSFTCNNLLRTLQFPIQ